MLGGEKTRAKQQDDDDGDGLDKEGVADNVAVEVGKKRGREEYDR